jgi:bifunctional pyridoxal-dependent enzyme with beta-cystathionase and maltose regulon repressor activities
MQLAELVKKHDLFLIADEVESSLMMETFIIQ